jgi:hypothetical protein
MYIIAKGFGTGLGFGMGLGYEVAMQGFQLTLTIFG